MTKKYQITTASNSINITSTENGQWCDYKSNHTFLQSNQTKLFQLKTTIVDFKQLYFLTYSKIDHATKNNHDSNHIT